jgi:hypothetical protein
MCDVVVQDLDPASSSSWTQVGSTNFSILVCVCAQLSNICVYFNPLLKSGHRSKTSTEREIERQRIQELETKLQCFCKD